MQHGFFIKKVLSVHTSTSCCIYCYLDCNSQERSCCLDKTLYLLSNLWTGGEVQTSAICGAKVRSLLQPSPASAGDLLCVPPEAILKPYLSPQSFKPLKSQGCRYCKIKTFEHLGLKVKMNETSINPKVQQISQGTRYPRSPRLLPLGYYLVRRNPGFIHITGRLQ